MNNFGSRFLKLSFKPLGRLGDNSWTGQVSELRRVRISSSCRPHADKRNSGNSIDKQTINNLAYILPAVLYKTACMHAREIADNIKTLHFATCHVIC